MSEKKIFSPYPCRLTAAELDEMMTEPEKVTWDRQATVYELARELFLRVAPRVIASDIYGTEYAGLATKSCLDAAEAFLETVRKRFESEIPASSAAQS